MNKLDRRTFLRGTGLGVGLPLLHAMNPNTSVFAAAPVPPPNRMAFVFFPNGAIMDSWKPTGRRRFVCSVRYPQRLKGLSQRL